MAPFTTSLFLLLFIPITAARAIGINYGTIADNLPPPSQVAAFIRDYTTIDSVKIFDANRDIIKAFAHTNISLTITVTDDAILTLSRPAAAKSWIAGNVLPFLPATRIRRIVVGNEILATSNKNIIAHLLPAMKSIHFALQSAGVQIQVSTPHSLGKISTYGPPSTGRFRPVYDRIIFAPILEFHRQTKTPFMICPYPYFGFNRKTLNFALFKPNGAVVDKATGLKYTNMFDAQIDAVYSAMSHLGYGDVDIVVAETGWPSAGDSDLQPHATSENARSYNYNLLQHLNSGVGTPLMPNRTFETYIFSLFNENLKPTTQERNFGLFQPNFQPVYDIGVLRSPQSAAARTAPETPPTSSGDAKTWCVPKGNGTNANYQQAGDRGGSDGCDFSNGNASPGVAISD